MQALYYIPVPPGTGSESVWTSLIKLVEFGRNSRDLVTPSLHLPIRFVCTCLSFSFGLRRSHSSHGFPIPCCLHAARSLSRILLLHAVNILASCSLSVSACSSNSILIHLLLLAAPSSSMPRSPLSDVHWRLIFILNFLHFCVCVLLGMQRGLALFCTLTLFTLSSVCLLARMHAPTPHLPRLISSYR